MTMIEAKKAQAIQNAIEFHREQIMRANKALMPNNPLSRVDREDMEDYLKLQARLAWRCALEGSRD